MCGGVTLKKRIIAISILCFLSMPKVHAEMEVSAKSAICLHYGTGQVLYAKNAEERLPMASTTKIMTALVALEESTLSDAVTVSANAEGVEGSSMYLRAGQTLSMEELLYGLMLSSGNDAAVAIAEHIAGSEEAFCVLMNQKAKALGCLDTQFKNANGLPDDAHYTTARELALITGKALENETFRKIVSQKAAVVCGKTITNHNKMLRLYEGAIGVKTGFTKKAGRTLVSAAEREGVRLISVTLNAPDDWDDHAKMLDAGFETLEIRSLAEKDMTAKVIPLEGGVEETVSSVFSESFSLPVAKGKTTETKMEVEPALSAPIEKGQTVGKAVFYLEGVPMGEMPLLAEKSVPQIGKPSFWESVRFVFAKWVALFV